MENRNTRWRTACLLILVSASCTVVREDRTDCPCFLYVSLAALPEESVEVRVCAEELCFQESVDRDTTLRVPVPRGRVSVAAISGAEWDTESQVRIPPGSDCPAVFLAAQQVAADRDTVRCRLRLHKHFCTLSLRFEGPPGWGEPYSVRIRGTVGGLSAEGRPLEGAFFFQLPAGERCRLPRQTAGDALWLDIVMPEGVLRSFALGTYLDAAGYDWTETDLKDAALRIDLSVTAVRFTIGLWSTTVPLDIVI